MDNSTPTLPEPDLFERLVTLVDADVAARGWYSPHVLIKVEAGDDDESFELGLKDLPEGAHPVDELWGFDAPSTWIAMGVVTFGWASPMGATRPSLHPDRTRVRATILVTRSGQEVMTASFEDGTSIDEPGEGQMADVLRRCLGVSTAPPPPMEHLAVVLWLRSLVEASSTRRLTVRAAMSMYHPPEGRLSTWEGARRLAESTGRWPGADGWMDDGFFARNLLQGLPPVDVMLDELDVSLPAATARRVRQRVDELIG